MKQFYTKKSTLPSFYYCHIFNGMINSFYAIVLVAQQKESCMEKKALVQLRLPHDVHQWLISFSSKNDRSMNGQMVTILKEKMQQQSQLKVGSEA